MAARAQRGRPQARRRAFAAIACFRLPLAGIAPPFELSLLASLSPDPPGSTEWRRYSRTCRSRSAFAMTVTELRLIAAAASIGESRKPSQG